MSTSSAMRRWAATAVLATVGLVGCDDGQRGRIDAGGGCSPGARRCSGLVPQQCTSVGLWQGLEAPCPYLCQGGVCAGVCSPGAQGCNGNTPRSCSQDAQWQSGPTCAGVCANGQCAAACQASTKQCDNLTPQTCVDGKWKDGVACPYVCKGGDCVGVCVPGSKQCAGSTPRSCSADGQWASGAPCPAGCVQGVCVVPVPDASVKDAKPTVDKQTSVDAKPTVDKGKADSLPTVTGTTYHVATTGNDTWPGTQAQPFKTIQHGVTKMVAGDAVLVHAGSYAPFSVSKSGMVQKPLIISAAGDGPVTITSTGSPAILIGEANYPPKTTVTDIIVSGFTVSGGGSWFGLIGISLSQRVTVKNNIVKGTLTSVSSSQNDNGISVWSGQQYTIEGNTVSDILEFGIYIFNSNSTAAAPAVIRNNEVTHCGYGVWAKDNDDGSDIDIWASSNILVESNVASTSAGNGILAEGGCSGITFRNNQVYDNNWAGIWANVADCVIEGNLAIGNHSCVWVNDTSCGNYEIRRNVCALNNKPTPRTTPGPALSIFESGSNVHIYNNVLYGNGEAQNPYRAGIGIGQWGNVGSGVVVRNNIVVDNLGPALRASSQSISSGLVVDHNLVLSSSTPLISWGGTNYSTLQAWQSASSQGAGSLASNPMFVKPTAANRADLDFHLQPGSPAINAGVDVGLAYVGSAPDMGAFEVGAP